MKIGPEQAKFLLPYAQIYTPIYAGGFPAWQDSAKLVHAYRLSAPDGAPLIALEGTTDLPEWAVDFMALPLFFPDHLAFGPMHAGFMRDALAVVDPIAAWLESQGWPAYDIVGHSKGAGEAQPLAALMKQRGHPPRRVILLEPPRAGTWLLRKYLSDIELHGTQTINCHGVDVVTEVPTDPPYVHVVDLARGAVPDTYSLRQKHVMGGVIDMLTAAAGV